MASHVDETTLNNTEIYTTPRDAAQRNELSQKHTAVLF